MNSTILFWIILAVAFGIYIGKNPTALKVTKEDIKDEALSLFMLGLICLPLLIIGMVLIWLFGLNGSQSVIRISSDALVTIPQILLVIFVIYCAHLIWVRISNFLDKPKIKLLFWSILTFMLIFALTLTFLSFLTGIGR